MADETGEHTGFYYNLSTKQVEQWGQSKGKDVLGPFPTEEAAANALETIRDREERTEYLLEAFGECPCDQEDYVTGDCALHDGGSDTDASGGTRSVAPRAPAAARPDASRSRPTSAAHTSRR